MSERKYWISEDRQSELGSWPVETPDQEIIAELLEQCGTDEERQGIEAGTIVTGEWTE